MKKKYVIISVILVLTVGISLYFVFKKKPALYKEAKVEKGSITLKILATGTVQPENRLQIKSPISGRAEQIFVKEGQKVYKGQVLAMISSTERAVMLDSARSQGKDEIKKWEEIYRPTPIVAPLAGMIILRSIEPGQTFTTSDAVFVMADRMTVEASVDETDLAQIYVDQKAEVNLDAYVDKKIEAKVSQVAFEAKTVNNVTTYTIQVLPIEKLDFLRSGMTANVTFVGTEKKDILIVPNEYIKYESGKAKVQVKTNDKPDNREVKLGITNGKITEIVSGLVEADTILLPLNSDNNSGSKKGATFSFGGGRRR
ncbi:efflux RND transporter periplasmic adaptor subunit [bacterium]|nr:efflux RND transporter periplasmic adaptor subunit [bacterium]